MVNNTDGTTIRLRENGKYEVQGWGGFDGFLVREFEEVEDAMDFIAYLWGLNSADSAYAADAQERDTRRRMVRRDRYKQQQQD